MADKEKGKEILSKDTLHKVAHLNENASFSKGATSTSFNAFGMALPGREPTNYRSQSGRSNYLDRIPKPTK